MITVVLNSCLLFVVLFYVYPLKYVTNAMFHRLIPEIRLEPPGTIAELSRLFIVYGAGYISVFAILALLHHRAWTKRTELGLTPLEAFDARGSVGTHLMSVSVGVLSIAWAAFSRGTLPRFAGFIYFLMTPFHVFYGMWQGKRRRRLIERQRPARVG